MKFIPHFDASIHYVAYHCLILTTETHMRRFTTRLLVAVLLGIGSAIVFARDFYGRGYTIISEEKGSDDLSVVIHRHLSADSVHLALMQLLSGTGWRLASRAAADPKIQRLYMQQLPEQKRHLGPMSLDAALVWIGGDGWRLVVDPVNKLISYEIKSQYRQSVIHEWRQVPNNSAIVHKKQDKKKRIPKNPESPSIPSIKSAD